MWGLHPPNLPFVFWTPFSHSRTTVVLLHIPIRALVTTILLLSSKSNFIEGHSVTGYAIPIFLSTQNYIAEVFDSTGTTIWPLDCFFLIAIIINADPIWSYYLTHFQQVLTKITVPDKSCVQ